MDRLTRPGIDADQTAVRFMDGEVKIQDIGGKLLDLILNGPTINGIKKDTLRHLVRQLYAELKLYEDILGDTYDLDDLVSLIEAAIHQFKPGDTLYWYGKCMGEYYTQSSHIVDVGTKGIFLCANGMTEEICELVPWDEIRIGEKNFLTKAEADAAKEKAKLEEV